MKNILEFVKTYKKDDLIIYIGVRESLCNKNYENFYV